MREKFLKKILKDERGVGLVESLFALAFIGMIIGAMLNLAMASLRMSYTNRVKNQLGQHANLVAEEMVKDYTLDGTLKTGGVPIPSEAGHYCAVAEVQTFLQDFDPEGVCEISSDVSTGTFSVTLTVSLYDSALSSTRTVILK